MRAIFQRRERGWDLEHGTSKEQVTFRNVDRERITRCSRATVLLNTEDSRGSEQIRGRGKLIASHQAHP